METKIGKKWKKLQLQYESIKLFILQSPYIPTKNDIEVGSWCRKYYSEMSP